MPIMDELSAIGQNITHMSKIVVVVDDIRLLIRKM